MGKFHESIQESHKSFISKQHLYFVATAPLSGDGRVNLSPKGMDSFRVIDGNKVAYMDLIGSGAETSAHILENGRITFMFCAFDGPPNILRLYGNGRSVLPDSEDWPAFAAHFTIYPSTRQIIVADIDLVQTSCGYNVPLYQYTGERDIHFVWAEKQGEEGLKTYIQNKNLTSIDGLPTLLGHTK